MEQRYRCIIDPKEFGNTPLLESDANSHRRRIRAVVSHCIIRDYAPEYVMDELVIIGKMYGKTTLNAKTTVVEAVLDAAMSCNTLLTIKKWRNVLLKLYDITALLDIVKLYFKTNPSHLDKLEGTVSECIAPQVSRLDMIYKQRLCDLCASKNLSPPEFATFENEELFGVLQSRCEVFQNAPEKSIVATGNAFSVREAEENASYSMFIILTGIYNKSVA